MNKERLIGNHKVYVWDNGEDFLDHSVWFVESDLDEEVVEGILNAAVSVKARRGGVVAVIPSDQVSWRQMRLESLLNWFTCYGDELINWRDRSVHESLKRLPKHAAKELAYRLYPSNAEIMAAELDIPS